MTQGKTKKMVYDPVNKYILKALSQGRAYTARELARFTNKKTDGISAHLDLLKSSKVIETEKYNGHDYFRLSDPAAIEQIKNYTEPDLEIGTKNIKDKGTIPPLHYCRSCYGHLAGKIGVQLTEKMLQQALLLKQEQAHKSIFTLTVKGKAFFREWDIPTDAPGRKPRIFSKACLDFSERKHHLGGALGKALLEKMFEKTWVKRINDSRVITVTEKGQKALENMLNIRF